MGEPSTTASNGRDDNGRFGPGNKLAKGNPYAKRIARLRSAMLKTVTPDDVQDVIRALLAKAKGGDVAAVRELLQRLIGPPVELDLIERLEALERVINELRERG